MKYFDNIFDTEVLDFIQVAAGLFLVLFGLPVLLYRCIANKKKKSE